MITKLLIANRGEIACRIIKTAKRLGIKTVAIYSDADQKSLHVRLADEAWRVGESLASQSYLNIEKILEIAKQTGVSGIHPGYGFLSENPDFAQACEEAGIIFVGPSIHAMNAMASKKFAKQLLEKTNVPLTPGYHGEHQSPEYLYQEAKKIGFPVLLKAAMGGGGKGMRSVFEEHQFYEALTAAKREALAYFKDDSMLIEKLIANPRHVEIQLMADHHGHVVHIFERDCSIQRRHQKIIEEAPAPHLSQNLRQALAHAAITVAQTIQYRGAGTVEFLVDSASESFYFMEMNTRLQVEHPVTEMITGLDLVEWQIRIAEGKALPLDQQHIIQQGHAIECRLYAEDPEQGFIPSVGQISHLQFPEGEGVRIDSGVENLDEISQFYDAMFAKLIVFGQTRFEAIQRMREALSRCQVTGIKTNVAFLQAIFETPDFINGDLHTDFLATHAINTVQTTDEHALLFAAAFEYLQQRPEDPLFQQTLGWHTYTQGHWVKAYRVHGQSYTLRITPHHLTKFTYQDEHDRATWVEITRHSSSQLQLIVDQKIITGTVIQNKPNELTLFTTKGKTIIEISDPNYDFQTQEASHSLCAPMPSTVVALLKNTGDTIKKGESLMVLEAMKMEHTIYAPDTGHIDAIFFSVGSQVNEGAILASITPVQEN
jgi:3-methylcrotonyl-CoA carboxylase alpha subunit